METYDRGYGHFTTRQNIQYNWIPLDKSADVMDLLASGNMHGIQTSGNCIRYITSDEREAIVKRLAQHFVDGSSETRIADESDAAIGEVQFIEELVADCLINTLFCVSRSFDDDGQIVEAFRKLEHRIDGGPIYIGEGEDQSDN